MVRRLESTDSSPGSRNPSGMKTPASASASASIYAHLRFNSRFQLQLHGFRPNPVRRKKPEYSRKDSARTGDTEMR